MTENLFDVRSAIETDVVYEEELKRDSYNVKIWYNYAKSKERGGGSECTDIFERALKYVPRSYKLWWNYLQFLMKSKMHSSNIIDVFERCLVHLSKMPRIWIDYCGFIEKHHFITKTRRTYDRALISLPVTQHQGIWDKYIAFAKNSGVQRTALSALRRYLMFQPNHVEVYVAYLISIGHYDEAATRLASVINDSEFVSIEGKTRHQLWIYLSEMITKYATDILSVQVDPILRSGIARFSDEVGRLWCCLAEYYIRLGHMEKAREIYEEALCSVRTMHDFGIVFDAAMHFLEVLASEKMEEISEAEADFTNVQREDHMVDLDLCLKLLENLLKRREELASSVKLRQNPHRVIEWINRAKIFKDNPQKVIRTFTEAVQTVDPQKAIDKVYLLWIEFAKYYEDAGDIPNAESVLERATHVNYTTIDDLALVWCEWIEMELRHERYDKALRVARQSVQPPRAAIKAHSDALQAKVFRSLRLWSIYLDLEEQLGTEATMQAAYDRMFELKVITPYLVLQYAHLLEELHYFEDSFRVYQRGIELFHWPQLNDIWMMYISKFISRYKGSKLERARELFEQALTGITPKYARRFYLMYAKLEEEYGLTRRALKIYDRATEAVEPHEMYDTYLLYIAKTAETFGIEKLREIFERAIEKLPTSEAVRNMCLQYVRIEKSLQEINRARGIYEHASQFCNPKKDLEFWQEWREFEVANGNEETFRDMLRTKRCISSNFA